ncbi:ABC transporter permease [Sinanaerobacter sp. ZZT-01]|uniref:ABC transporter permease n=1 Tax=Sinanaerobacter sp. ZZT-01 TaxID=3111540 RepID=UPI002D790A16|nr:FtsX-like permease family protein [Sinanaerobacter sp. ZZT-01]WRR93824.1 FtsX-like permease family protein [Sinanaerobacter sp. ZZT-01]
MFENNNRKIVKKLAVKNMKANRNRSLIMVTAIFLTTVLISFILTAGFSFFTTMHEASEAAPGPGADGALIGSKAVYEKAVLQEEVEWADFVRKCSTTSLHNDAFAGVQTELFAPDKGFYTNNYITLAKGDFPKVKTQILISDTLAQKMDVQELHTEIPLQVVVLQDGKELETEISMEVCGIYKNPLANISSVYEEIYTAQGFIDTYNPELSENQNLIYVKLNNLNPFLLKSDVFNKLSDLSEAVNADSVQTRHYMEFAYSFTLVLPLLFFVLLIMMSGYFLIHNVFSISLASDIRWFGMMKTIGTSKKQLQSMYMKQIRFLACIGIFLGILAGYGVGLLLAPEVIRMTDYYLYYKAPNLWLILCFTVLFSWFTVWISCSRTLRKAASYSPIEAARFIPRHKNKVFTVISFALSGMIFLTVCNVAFGYQVEKMVDRYNQDEAQIVHIASMWDLNEPYKPISKELPSSIEKLPFVESFDIVYRAKTMPDLIETVSQRMYENFLAEVKLEGKLKAEIDAIAQVQGDRNFVYFLPNGNTKLGICGLPARRLEQEAAYIKVQEGQLDIEKFKSGSYILYQDVDYLNVTDQQVDQNQKIHAGDVLDLSFYDDVSGTYKTKRLTVMAVIMKMDKYGTGNIAYSNIVMPDTLFQSIYPNYDERISSIQIISKDSLNGQQIEELTGLLEKEHNVQLRIDSRYEGRDYYTHRKAAITILGFFLALVLGIIGISNMVNTLITDTLAQKKTILIFQAVGMTKKQLWRFLFKNSLRLCLISAGIMLAAGSYLSVTMASSSMFTGFNPTLFGLNFLLLLVFMGALCATISSIMTRQLNKKSVVERLRAFE